MSRLCFPTLIVRSPICRLRFGHVTNFVILFIISWRRQVARRQQGLCIVLSYRSRAFIALRERNFLLWSNLFSDNEICSHFNQCSISTGIVVINFTTRRKLEFHSINHYISCVLTMKVDSQNIHCMFVLQSGNVPNSLGVDKAEKKLQENEDLMKRLTGIWEEKWSKTQRIIEVKYPSSCVDHDFFQT